MAEYSGTVAGRIIEIQESSWIASRGEKAVDRLLKQELTAALHSSTPDITAAQAADKINESAKKAIESLAELPKEFTDEAIFLDTVAARAEQVARNGERKETPDEKNIAFLIKAREILDAKNYLAPRPRELKDTLSSTITALEGALKPAEQSERQKIVAAMELVEKKASAMDAALKTTTDQIKNLAPAPSARIQQPTTTLKLLYEKFDAINQEIEALQKKAGKTKNPTENAALKLEAETILRLHNEVGVMLNEKRVRDSLAASFKESAAYEAFQIELARLRTQQSELIKIAGKKEKDFTAISHVATIPENDHTGIITHEKKLYSGVSYKEQEKDELGRPNGKWKTKTLMGKKYNKPVTGLTRAEIMAAILSTEIKLRAQLNDPSYKIKVTEDRDGTIHYDTGNSRNRGILHDEFSAAYDLKMDAKAAEEAKAKAQVQHVAAPAAETKATTEQKTTETQVQHQPAQATGSRPDKPDDDKTPQFGS